MNTTTALTFLLLLLLAAGTAQGIRMGGETLGFDGFQKKSMQVETNNLTGGKNGVGEITTACKETGHCTTSSGRSRKFMSKNMHKVDFSVSTPLPATAAAAEKYPDLFDLAGMDYSPAKRKPPIHN